MGLKKSKQQVYLIKDHSNIAEVPRLEDLSNDLIYELFDYLSFHEISLAFTNLNSRFEHLIDDYTHYVNMQQSYNEFLPRNIHSLKITGRYQLHSIDLSTLGSLHALSLSNLRTMYLLHMINTLSLEELEYVYLSGCFRDDGMELQQIGEIQEKILSLGQLKLQKCVFRMKFCGNIQQLPMQLSSLRYLRIDGCENILLVNELLDRMPNLQSLYVSLLESTSLDDHHIQSNNKHQHLTHVTIRLYSNTSLEQLSLLFHPHGSNIRNLTIYLESIREYSGDYNRPSHHLLHLYPKVTAMIHHSLPQLTNFQLRQHILSQDFNFLHQRRYFTPYVEEIPSLFEHPAYRVSIAKHLADLWQKR